MRLTLIISSLCAGGAERVLSTMANHWAAKGWLITLLTLDDGRQSPFYPLHADVSHRPLGVACRSHGWGARISNNLHRVRTLRAAIRKSRPQAVISMLSETNVLTLLASRGLGLPVLVQEQIDPHQHPLCRTWERMRRLTYPSASCLVVLGERSLRYFPPAVQQRARIIPNPAHIPALPAPAQATPPAPGKHIMAMGRLEAQKGFDLLLDAFARAGAHHPDWSLVIWGEGPLRSELEAQIRRLKLAGRVRLPGTTHDPFTELRRANLFVLSSRYEGFPLSLCEAMACGAPVLSFACPSGPGEIIRDQVDGVLVAPEDVEALAGAMDALMGDDARRLELAKRAPEVLERFGLTTIMALWEEAIAAAISTEAQRARQGRLKEMLKTLVRQVPGAESLLWWVRSRLPNARLHGMTSVEEQRYFHRYASQIHRGEGEIVDLGCWLGSTTIPLAKGLAHNPHPAARQNRVHAYDQFLWETWMDPFMSRCERRYQPGESFLDEFKARTRSEAGRIEIHPGDLRQLGWSGQPIEFLLVDAMKSWELARAIVRNFYPSLLPGKALVLHQDFKHYYTSWIHLIHYRLRDCFAFENDVPHSGSVVFRVIKPIPGDLAWLEHLEHFPDEEVHRAFAHSMALVNDDDFPSVAAAKVMHFIHLERFSEARRIMAGFIDRGLSLQSDLGICWRMLAAK